MRGTLGGGFWGLVVGGAAVVGASLLGPPPAGDVANASVENARVTDDDAAPAGSTESPVGSVAAPDVTAPAAESPAPPALTADAPVAGDIAPSSVATPEESDAPAEIATDTPTLDVTPETQSPTIEPEEPASNPGAAVTAEVDALETPDVGSAPEAVTSEAPAPAATDAPAVVAATSDATEDAPAADIETADQPVVAVADALPPPTDAPADAAAVAPLADDTPVSAKAPATAPAQPESDTFDVATAAVADPPGLAPDITSTAPSGGDAPAVDVSTPEVGTADDAVGLVPETPASPVTPPSDDDVPVADTTPADAIEDAPSGPVGEDQTIVVVTPESLPDDVEVVIIEDEDTSTPTVSILPSGSGAVKVNRFGQDAADETAEADTDAAPDPEAFPEGTPALVRYAVPGENPAGLPELSVILVDDGDLSNAVNAVANISFPVSVMLNPGAPDAAARMAAYRAAGIEVGVLATLPPSATPTDVAIFFEAALANLPETVAVLDAGGETQADTEVIRETVAALAQDGRGLITVPRGLNSAQRVASESGVPAAMIYRDLDADGEDGRVIRRFMDQAAFRAGQESGVILLGRVRDETVTALTEWAGGSRATQVAMQPVSAVLGATAN